MSESKRNNYQYRSSQEWEEIFEEFEASNQSKTVFCKEHGIKPSTFIDKLRRRREKHNSSKEAVNEIPDFIPVTVASNPVNQQVSAGEELIITIGNASITVTPGFDPAFLQSVASTLASIC